MVALGVSLYAIASNVGAGWLYVVASGVWAALLVSTVAPLWSARGVELVRRAPATGTAGEPLPCALEVRSAGRLARYLLETEDRFAGGTGRAVVVRATRNAPTKVEYRIEHPRRGIYEGGEVLVESGAPFGLFSGRDRVRVPEGKTVIHPRIFEVDGLPVSDPDGWRANGHDADDPRKGEEGGFWGVREYRSGDPRRLVAWRRSARSLAGGADRLAVVETTQQAQPPLTVALDLSPRTPPEAREMVVSAAASMVLRALQEGRRVLADAGPLAEPSPEDAGVEELLRWCAGLAPGPPPETAGADLAVLSALRQAPVPETETIVLVSRAALPEEGSGSWMTPEEERGWVSGAESAGQRVIRLGSDLREPWRVA